MSLLTSPVFFNHLAGAHRSLFNAAPNLPITFNNVSWRCGRGDPVACSTFGAAAKNGNSVTVKNSSMS